MLRFAFAHPNPLHCPRGDNGIADRRGAPVKGNVVHFRTLSPSLSLNLSVCVQGRTARKGRNLARLALVMIVRNEAKNIARCLRSVKPYVNEMIVLDTGSTDDTAAIARKMGAKVRRFDWIDDFSAARNEALGHSNADWNLVLDADEWIDGNAGQLSARVLGREPFIGVVQVDNRLDICGQEGIATSWIPRILPRGVRYEGRVHEQPVSELPRCKVALKVGHGGYRDSELTLKKGRNIALLLEAMKDAPSDGYYLYQLGKEYDIHKDHARAAQYYIDASQNTASGAYYRHDLIIRLIYSLKKASRHEEAIDLANRELPNWEHSPDFYFTLGDLLLDWAMMKPVEMHQELIQMVEASWLKCLEIGEKPDLEGCVKGRGSFFAAYLLSELYSRVGDAARAETYSAMSKKMRKASK